MGARLMHLWGYEEHAMFTVFSFYNLAPVIDQTLESHIRGLKDFQTLKG